MTPALPDTGDLEALGHAVFDHAAVAAPRIRDLLPLYAGILGGELINGGDNARVGYRALQLGFPDGSRIELMEPLRDSPFFDRFFARGGGLHHVTFKVDDIGAAIARLEAAGVPLTGVYLDDPEWREAFVHPRDGHGVLVQIAEAAPGFPSMPEGMTIEDVLAGRGDNGTLIESP
jgi:methylmalonyl-CoA/ethylmalonyl-CoA epimerase